MAYVETRRKELKTDWPNEVGTTFGTTKQEGQALNLVPVLGSTVFRRNKVGL